MKAVLFNRILLVLGFIGLFISGFLSIAHFLDVIVPCGKSAGCEKVTSDPTYSQFLGVPVAYWGFLGYLVLTILAVIRATKGLEATRKLIMPGYFVAAAGTIASLFLQYASLMFIHQLCYWCLASAITMVATLIFYALLAQTVDDAAPDTIRSDPLGFQMSTALIAILVIALGFSGYKLKESGKGGPPLSVDESKLAKAELLPKDAHVYGDPNARLTIVEFADVQCPACRRTTPRLEEFVKENQGRVKLVYRHFPLLERHPLALPGALIGEAAADKGKFFDFLLAVMKSGGDEDLGADSLYEVARRVGLDDQEIRRRIDNPEDPIYARVQRDMKAADLMGLNVTPTIFLLIDGKVRYIASSNDVFDVLQRSPFKEVLSGALPGPVGGSSAP